MKGLMSRLILPCEKASLLVIKKEENKLTITEKKQLWLHTLMCGLCKEFDVHNDFINVNLEKHYNNGAGHIEFTEDEKKKMKTNILEENK